MTLYLKMEAHIISLPKSCQILGRNNKEKVMNSMCYTAKHTFITAATVMAYYLFYYSPYQYILVTCR